ncbi:hypothetical protein HYDPIDRAFT_116527 [Hydnomerulius pinastri MD-312]|uniref:Uncharacterized protein n=1 Tax=Hydnomerulius pinastri MD-312 TaxID=994086 RepID=A0A0C9VSX7_9AGAM|nr:hypothetical protein HYDPIDRAFT_116527 [Hydnomerulius pinastri MD-312]
MKYLSLRTAASPGSSVRLASVSILTSYDPFIGKTDLSLCGFSDGSRLTLNVGSRKSGLYLAPEPEPKTPASECCEEKPPSDTSHTLHDPAGSPDATSTPIASRTSSFIEHPSIESEEPRPQAQAHAHVTFPQRVAAKVKALSRDRAEAMASDPKLAPVQGPLRPLSMHPSPTRGKRLTLFGFGHRDAKHEDTGKDADGHSAV